MWLVVQCCINNKVCFVEFNDKICARVFQLKPKINPPGIFIYRALNFLLIWKVYYFKRCREHCSECFLPNNKKFHYWNLIFCQTFKSASCFLFSGKLHDWCQPFLLGDEIEKFSWLLSFCNYNMIFCERKFFGQ